MDICTNLQKKRWIGKHFIWVVMELLYKAHHIRQKDFSHLPQIWKQSIQMSPFAVFIRPTLDLSTDLQKKFSIGEQIFLLGMELLNKAHHIRNMDFSHLPQIWK